MITTAFALVVALGGAACATTRRAAPDGDRAEGAERTGRTSGPRDVGDPELVPGAPPTHAVLAGRIDPADVSVLAGAKVAVYSVGERGKLARISKDGGAKSDAEGRFQLEVALPEDGPHDLLVTAEHAGAGGRGAVVVPSWAVVDGVIVASPITVETAVESDVYLMAVREGIWRISIGSGEIRAFVSPEVAARVRASPSYDRDILALAHASSAGVEAWYQSLLRPEVGLDLERLRTILEAVGWAQVALDAQLYAAEDAEQTDEAKTIHRVVVSAAYGSIGLDPGDLALAAQASADAMLEFAPTMTNESHSSLVADAEAFRARHVTLAVEHLFHEAGAPERDRLAVRSAGQRLEGRILSAGLGTPSREELDVAVKRAWTEYRSDVQGRLHLLRERDGDEPEPGEVADDAII
ncbi:hypothetical protein L6R52_18825 [Myxococcota bacterium]|nr:hypothetical protein [Myxococcota bacterium]